MSLRNLLYKAASFLGSLNAVKKNKVPEHIVRKKVTKATQKEINKFLNSVFKD